MATRSPAHQSRHHLPLAPLRLLSPSMGRVAAGCHEKPARKAVLQFRHSFTRCEARISQYREKPLFRAALAPGTFLEKQDSMELKSFRRALIGGATCGAVLNPNSRERGCALGTARAILESGRFAALDRHTFRKSLRNPRRVASQRPCRKTFDRLLDRYHR